MGIVERCTRLMGDRRHIIYTLNYDNRDRRNKLSRLYLKAVDEIHRRIDPEIASLHQNFKKPLHSAGV